MTQIKHIATTKQSQIAISQIGRAAENHRDALKALAAEVDRALKNLDEGYPYTQQIGHQRPADAQTTEAALRATMQAVGSLVSEADQELVVKVIKGEIESYEVES